MECLHFMRGRFGVSEEQNLNAEGAACTNQQRHDPERESHMGKAKRTRATLMIRTNNKIILKTPN